MKEIVFEYNGFEAIIRIPENANGKWIWKTEFFDAFDKAERALMESGYTRVYYRISNRYGSVQAVRLMHAFHRHLIKEFGLRQKCILFGFSRGGLYAFNYALFYPEYVFKIYLDAPVLDLKTWPLEDSAEQKEMLAEYNLDKALLQSFTQNPVDNLKEFFQNQIPLLIVAGLADEVVPFESNSLRVIRFCEKNKIPITYYLKPNCKHHPHSLEDISSIITFCENDV